MLEKAKGQPIEEISGYNQLQGQIDSIQLQAFSKVDAHKEDLVMKMGKRREQMTFKIDSEKPKIPYYDSLLPDVQGVILRQAESHFGDTLASNKEAIAKQIEQEFNPESLLEKFSQFNPDQQLGGLTGQASQFIMNALGLEGAGGLIQTALNFLSR
jgi:hypothetical protein